ncbi:MAG: hypothetical protein FE042_06740 [Thermoplasmata archaeon]|nr:MAG: hypothetical protein FE042_06740 [Thermoplasmata archaeon]
MVGKGIMEKTALLSVIGIIIAGLTVPSVAISEPENIAVPHKDTPEAEVILSTSFEERKNGCWMKITITWRRRAGMSMVSVKATRGMWSGRPTIGTT